MTLDNTPGFTVGTSIYEPLAQQPQNVQPSWTINPGSPAGTSDDGPRSPRSLRWSFPAVLPIPFPGVPLITVYPYNPVTINAPLAGNQGLHVNGGG